MKEYLSQKLKEVHLELETIDLDSEISIEVAVSMIEYLEKCLVEVRKYFLSLKTIKDEDEIVFFKEIKPEILGFLLYFNKIHTIDLKCPNSSNDTLTEYYQKELDSLTYLSLLIFQRLHYDVEIAPIDCVLWMLHRENGF